MGVLQGERLPLSSRFFRNGSIPSQPNTDAPRQFNEGLPFKGIRVTINILYGINRVTISIICSQNEATRNSLVPYKHVDDLPWEPFLRACFPMRRIPVLGDFTTQGTNNTKGPGFLCCTANWWAIYMD